MTALRPTPSLLRAGLLATALLAAPAAFAVVHDAGHGVTVDRRVAPQHRGAETLHAVRLDRRDFQANAVAGRALDLPGTGATTQRARFERSEQQGENYTWIGKVDTDLGEQAVVVTFGADAVFGTIPQQHGQPLRIEAHSGRAWLVEGQGRSLMHDGAPNDARIPPRAKGKATASVAPPRLLRPADVLPVVDVLVAYTPSLVTLYGSDAAARTRITYLAELANQAYRDTPAHLRINVVAQQLLDYTQAASSSTLLDLISLPSTNATKTQIDAWREQYAADLVVVVRAFDSVAHTDCGQGWIGDYHGAGYYDYQGFAVVGDGSSGGTTCADQSFAHEIGHNLGSHHDYTTAAGDYGSRPWSRGYRETISPTSGFATVMAYTTGPQVRLNRFSNPHVIACYSSVCGASYEADNAMTFGDAGAQVAAYRGGPVQSDPRPALSLSVVDVAEGNSGSKSMLFRVALSAPTQDTVYFRGQTPTLQATATAGVDYVLVPPTQYQIPAGASYVDVPVTINGDTATEQDEFLEFYISDASGATLPPGDTVARGKIIDDDPPQLRIEDASVAEGYPGTTVNLSFVVRLSQWYKTPTTFTFAAGQIATAATPNVDFVPVPPTVVTIPAGEQVVVMNVVVKGDGIDEPNEAILATLSNVSGAVLADGAARGTILDDDLPTFTLSDATVVEGNDGIKYASIVATLSRASEVPVAFSYDARDMAATATLGAATAGVDYPDEVPQVASIPAGQLSKVISFPINGDNTIEMHEHFAVRLDWVEGALYSDDRAEVIIRNDDKPVLYVQSFGVQEGNSGSQVAVFTLRLTGPAADPVLFDIATQALPASTTAATPGVDYLSRSITGQGIPIGGTYGTFRVTILGDTTSEDNEKFGIVVNNLSGATWDELNGFGTILNDDKILLRIADATLVEGNYGTRQMNFVISNSAPINWSMDVVVSTYDTPGATAKPGTDYTAKTQTVTIPANARSAAFSVPILSDTIVEPTETFVVTLSGDSLQYGLADGAAKGTITNDD